MPAQCRSVRLVLIALLVAAGLLIAQQAGASLPAESPGTAGKIASQTRNLPIEPPQAAAASDSGSFGIQLLDAPVSAQADPRAKRYIVDHLPPGVTIERRVLVVNKSDHPLTLEVYPGAAAVDDQAFQFGEGQTGNELTGWISLAMSRVDLGASERKAVPVTIAVPANASRGERYGVIWASASSLGRPGAVAQVHRVGVRIYLDVGPGGDPITDFEIGELTASREATGIPAVAVAVTNTGERALDMTGSATLSNGPAGLGAGPFTVTEGSTLAPGESGHVTIGFPAELPNGPWTIDLELSSGKVHHTLNSTITFPDSGGADLSSGGSNSPWWVIGGIVALALLVLAVALFFARRRTSSGLAVNR